MLSGTVYNLYLINYCNYTFLAVAFFGITFLEDSSLTLGSTQLEVTLGFYIHHVDLYFIVYTDHWLSHLLTLLQVFHGEP